MRTFLSPSCQDFYDSWYVERSLRTGMQSNFFPIKFLIIKRLLTQCVGDSKEWCRCGNQQLGQTISRIAFLFCQLLGNTHWCEGCKDFHLCFPRIQSLFHHGNLLLKITNNISKHMSNY